MGSPGGGAQEGEEPPPSPGLGTMATATPPRFEGRRRRAGGVLGTQWGCGQSRKCHRESESGDSFPWEMSGDRALHIRALWLQATRGFRSATPTPTPQTLTSLS